MKRIIPAIMICILLLTGCGDAAGNEVENDAPAKQDMKKDLKSDINLDLRPNEAGKIMILMYHNIGPEEGEWVRTPDNFLKDLQTLYEKGYRPISLKDYASGNITTEQGFTPVVITFDDGNLNNFEYLENGHIKEDCAVGLLLRFHEAHPDFPLEATFFLNGEHPFRQDSLISKKLEFLVDHGMDVGNHTKDHNSFKNASLEEIQEQIGSQARFLQNALNRDDYEVDTLALPFGERPKEEGLKKYLAAGSFDGAPYENIAVMNVGWNPAYSPYDGRFDHTSIPRIRGSEMKVDHVGIYNYIEYFEEHPEERFISDGVAEIITVPKEKADLISAPGDKEVYPYEIH